MSDCYGFPDCHIAGPHEHATASLTSGSTANPLEERDSLPCQICNLPVIFEFTVESATWNMVVRDSGSPEYICLWCFDKLAVEAGTERIPVGVNVGGKVTHSAWCNDDVPGTYPGEVSKADLENQLKDRAATIAELSNACRHALTIVEEYESSIDENGRGYAGTIVLKRLLEAALVAERERKA